MFSSPGRRALRGTVPVAVHSLLWRTGSSLRQRQGSLRPSVLSRGQSPLLPHPRASCERLRELRRARPPRWASTGGRRAPGEGNGSPALTAPPPPPRTRRLARSTFCAGAAAAACRGRGGSARAAAAAEPEGASPSPRAPRRVRMRAGSGAVHARPRAGAAGGPRRIAHARRHRCQFRLFVREVDPARRSRRRPLPPPRSLRRPGRSRRPGHGPGLRSPLQAAHHRRQR